MIRGYVIVEMDTASSPRQWSANFEIPDGSPSWDEVIDRHLGPAFRAAYAMARRRLEEQDPAFDSGVHIQKPVKPSPVGA